MMSMDLEDNLTKLKEWQELTPRNISKVLEDYKNKSYFGRCKVPEKNVSYPVTDQDIIPSLEYIRKRDLIGKFQKFSKKHFKKSGALYISAVYDVVPKLDSNTYDKDKFGNKRPTPQLIMLIQNDGPTGYIGRVAIESLGRPPHSYETIVEFTNLY